MVKEGKTSGLTEAARLFRPPGDPTIDELAADAETQLGQVWEDLRRIIESVAKAGGYRIAEDECLLEIPEGVMPPLILNALCVISDCLEDARRALEAERLYRPPALLLGQLQLINEYVSQFQRPTTDRSMKPLDFFKAIERMTKWLHLAVTSTTPESVPNSEH